MSNVTLLESPAQSIARPAATPVDPSAFAELLEGQRERLLQVARRYVGCPHVAADIVQDAALAALAALPTFQGRANLATWLHRIVVNAALMHLRRVRTRREGPLEGAALPPVQVLPDPAERVEASEVRASLAACLLGFPGNQRNVLDLCLIQGLDAAGTASALGISHNAAKIRLHRARRALRDRFEGRRPAGDPLVRRAAAEDVPIFDHPRSRRRARVAG